MPFNPNFYGPTDWYDPSYRVTPRMKAPTIRQRLSSKFEDLMSSIAEQPVAKVGGALGDLFDKGYRGNTRNDPDWKIAGMPDVPWAKTSALVNKLKAARAAGQQEKVLAEVIAKSKVAPEIPLEIRALRANRAKPSSILPDIEGTSRVLDPVAGSIPKSAQLRTKETWPYLPNRLLPTEGSVKRGLLEPAAKIVARPSIPYIRQEMRKAGYLPDITAPKQLTSPNARFYAGARGIEDARNPIPFGGGTADLTPIARASDIPNTLPDFTPPPIKPIASPLGGGRKPLIPNAKGNIGSTLQDWGYRSITDKINADSRAGQLAADLITTTRLQEERLAGSLKLASRKNRASIVKDPEKWDEFVTALDTGMQARPEVQKFVDIEKAALANFGSRAEASGMGFKTPEGTLLKFQSRENYWPHQYGDDFYKNPEVQIAALSKRYGITVEEANKIIIRSKEHGGRLIPENEAVRKRMAEFGERYISPQHTRELDLPGFLRTPEALDRHYTNMSKRIVEAENFGPMDIADNKSPLGSLLAQTTDEPSIRAYMERILGREIHPNVPKSKAAKAASTILKGEAAVHLSLFPISNAQQLAAIPLKTGIGPFVKSLYRKVIDRTGVRERAFGGGAMEAADTDALQEMGGKSTVNKTFGMSRSERTVRSAANEAGQIHVNDLFNDLKRNPTNDRIRNKIEDLTRTPSNQLLTQDALTQEQIDLAGARLSETTMGRAQPMDLPYAWSGGPGANLLLLFKKYGYRQAHTMLNAIKENPVKNVPLALLGFGIAGEVAGDIKATIRGSIAGTIKSGEPIEGAWEEIKKRGQWMKLSKNPTINRMVDNYSQAWLLGLPADALSAVARSDKDLWKFLGGPVLGDLVDIFTGTAEALTTGNASKLANKGVRSIPYIGSGLAATMKKPTPVAGTRTRKRR